jgi:predicted MFS family arabinose efflux permease
MVDVLSRNPRGHRPATPERWRTPLALAALAAAAFVYVTAETFPIGLLPQLSRGLHVSGGDVGLLVTVYAGVAALTAIPLTALTNHLPRRRLLVGAVALLAVSQLVVALAPDYATVMGARAVCAAAHGVFWSIIAPVAASLVVPERAGRAMAAMFAGNSLALVLGSPLATALGVAFGWRVAAALVALAGAVVCVALARLIPELDDPVSEGGSRQRLAAIPLAMKNLPLLSVCLVTGVIVIGHFSAYTYISRLIQRDAGLTGLSLSLVLFAYGAAGILGNIAAGWVTDRRPRLAVLGCTMTLAIALIVLAVFGRGSTAATVIAVALWGAAFTAVPVCMQSGVLRVAPADPDTASAIYVVAFQIGIGGGALAGSLLVDAGRLASLPVVAVVCFVVGTLIAATSRLAFPARTASRRSVRA